MYQKPECWSCGHDLIWGGDHDDEDADTQWGEAMEHITNQLGVVFDGETEQWVTADEGHPV